MTIDAMENYYQVATVASSSSYQVASLLVVVIKNA